MLLLILALFNITSLPSKFGDIASIGCGPQWNFDVVSHVYASMF